VLLVAAFAGCAHGDAEADPSGPGGEIEAGELPDGNGIGAWPDANGGPTDANATDDTAAVAPPPSEGGSDDSTAVGETGDDGSSDASGSGSSGNAGSGSSGSAASGSPSSGSAGSGASSGTGSATGSGSGAPSSGSSGAPVDAAIDAPVVCANTLSNIRDADFRIAFTVTTPQMGLVSLLNQRTVCGHTTAANFWDVRLASGGVRIEMYDGKTLTDFTANPASSAANGQPHDILIRRTAGVLAISVDGTPIGKTSGKATFAQLAALREKTDVCDGHSGEVSLTGMLTNVCVSSP
jgi:hypothetical protein